MLFFPLFFLCRLATNRCQSPGDILAESIRNFRDRGFTLGRFLTRCSLFCLLWVGTNYMYISSLRILLATDVMALFATNVACVYLLSWVILHEQFVGIRVSLIFHCSITIFDNQKLLYLNLSAVEHWSNVPAEGLQSWLFIITNPFIQFTHNKLKFQIVAVILCDTGIALLAYMDGITGSPTLGAVVLAFFSAAGSAVYKVRKVEFVKRTFILSNILFSLIFKVLFKKVIGEATYGQVALFFSVIGLLNAALLWPVSLTLYFTGVETLYWDLLPWPALLLASILSLSKYSVHHSFSFERKCRH